MNDDLQQNKERAVSVMLDILDLMERVGYLEKQRDRQHELDFLYRERMLNIERWVYDVIPQASPQRLREWRYEYRRRGQGKRGTGYFASDSPHRKIAMNALRRNIGVSAVDIHRAMERYVAWEEAGWGSPEKAPSLRTVRRYAADVKRLASIIPITSIWRWLEGENTPATSDQSSS